MPRASPFELSDLSYFGIRLTPAPNVWEELQAPHQLRVVNGLGCD